MAVAGTPERLRSGVAHGNWKTTTLVAGLRRTGMVHRWRWTGQFSKLKAHLRKAAERTIHGLWNAIGRILDLYPPQECANYFANAGYDAD